MSIQYDPRLQNKQNTTDILQGQPAQEQAPESPSQAQPAQPSASPAPLPQEASQANLATTKPKSSSGMFTNIQNYIQKNQPASQNMAKSIGNTVQRSSDIARKNIQATQNQFGNLMEQGSLQNRGSAVQDITQAAQQASTMQAGQAPTSGDQRLKSILDAQYQGPQRLQDLGTFGQTQAKAQEAQRLRQQLTSGNRQELLDKSLERPGSKYTQGSRRLDELLFNQGEPQKYLQNIQQQIGDVGQDLQSAQQTARTDAIQRSREIGDIRSQARQALQSAAQQRAVDVEAALTGQMEAGQALSDYYRDILSGSEGGLDLGSLEAETLGARSGAGLYNILSNEQEREALLDNLDATSQLDRAKLISADEQAQLAELQRLAQLSEDYGVTDSGLDFRSAYQDANLAGTQDALAALNLQGFGDALTEAETRFREEAGRDVITGVGRGKAKYNRGWGRGRKSVKKTAYETANLRDILQDAGYDFESDPSQYVGEANTDILRDISNIQRQSQGEQVDLTDPDDMLDYAANPIGTSQAALSSLGLGNIIPNIPQEEANRALLGAGVGAGLASAGIGGSVLGSAMLPAAGKAAAAMAALDVGSKVADQFGSDLENARIFGDAGALVGETLSGVGGGIQSGISSVFGGGKSGARKKARAKARSAAMKDLQRKLTDRLTSSGFANRLNVADTEETQERQRNLLDILGRIR